MPPVAIAIGGAALLGAGASVVAADKNSSAIKQSTDTSLQAQRESLAAQQQEFNQGLQFQKDALAQSSALQTGAFNSSGQTQTDIYNNNVGALNPWVQQGYGATNQINSMLGIPGVGNPTGAKPITFHPIETPTPAPTSSPTPALPPGYNPNLNMAGTIIPAYARGTNWHPGGPALVGENGPEVVNLPQGSQVVPNSSALGGWGQQHGANPPAAGTPAPASTPASTISPQAQALDSFYNTQFYQFPLQQGLNAINANYAGRGLLQSGAAQKSLENYASGVASGAFGDYLQTLGNQQGLGFSAGSALAGIGQGYANSITNLNGGYSGALSSLNSNFANNATSLAGGLAGAQGQYATNVGNINSGAIMANANNTNSMINGVGSALGNAAGYFAYSPYSFGGGGSTYASLAPAVSSNIAANPGIF